MLTVLFSISICLAAFQPAGQNSETLDNESLSRFRLERTREFLEAARKPAPDESAETAMTRAIESAANALVNLRVWDGFPMQASWNHAKLLVELNLVGINDPLATILAMDGLSTAGFLLGDRPYPDIMPILATLKERGLPPHLLTQLATIGFNNNQTRESAISFAVREAAEAIRTPYASRADKRIVYATLDPMLDAFTDAGVEEIRRLLTENPPVDPWLMHALFGQWHQELAWRRRGSQLARDTTDAQFDAFNEQLAVAREHLTAAYAIDPMCPEPAAEMISIAKTNASGGDDSIEAWFRRAYEAQSDYAPAYDSMRTALRPRWGGSVDRIRRFALWCAEPGRHAGVVGLQSWITFMTLRSEIGQDVWRDDELVSAVETAIEHLQARELTGVSPWYCSTVLMEIALNTGRTEEAASHLRALGNGLGRWQLRMRDRPHLPYLPELLPFDSAGKEHARLAQDAEEADDWPGAVVGWTRALADVEVGDDPQAHKAIQDRLTRAERKAALRAGEWIELDYSEDGIGSRLIAGEITSLGKGIVSVQPESNEWRGPAVVLFDIEVEDRYEIECDLWRGEGALILGWSERRDRHDAYTSIMRSNAGISIEHTDAKAITAEVAGGDAERPVRVRVRVEGTTLTIWVDGVSVYNGPAPSDQIANGERMGVGRRAMLPAWHRLGNEQNRVANVRLRLIPLDQPDAP